MREQCEASAACAPLAEGFEDDCVLRCMNPRCWRLVYSSDPLEPGQIDRARATQFDTCLRTAEAPLKAAGLWPPRMSGLTNALQEVADMEFLGARDGEVGAEMSIGTEEGDFAL